MEQITKIQTSNSEKQKIIDSLVKIWSFCFGGSESDKRRYNKILKNKSIEWLRTELDNDKILFGDKISHLDI